MAAGFRAVLLLLWGSLAAAAQADCGGFSVLAGLGLADTDTLGVKVLDSPAVDLDEECLEKCCSNPDCDLALLRGPHSDCRLVSCTFNGFNMCDLRELEGARSYLRPGVGGKPGQRDFCLSQAETGRCRAFFLRWWYDVDSQTCKNFTYGGCQGNLNNHLDEQQCMDKCSGVTAVNPSTDVLPTSKRMVEAQSQNDAMPEPEKVKAPESRTFEEFCAAPKYTGPCRAYFQRWYYNAETGACNKFTYGGCQGNKNNYMSEAECAKTCIDELENIPIHHRSATTLALPILLAVMAGILLCAMVLFFVKMAKNSQRASDFRAMWNPIDDKELLMNNAYTL
ncbi:kunitz-type protease inhibitor 2 isoform X1 [Pelobates cultripes]|uniref:Kunitz-type protease inhibitor 2 isoform X1 n=1 Tax=Pelobates cultripes TaxID=61616 RepID=A0AAD1WHQ6_PELCU|nr:kunitz-type protease inhibitor 2 isoform X1 [Pelobates cultripes]